MSTPPPIPPKHQFHSPQAQSPGAPFSTPFVILGILLLVLGIVFFSIYFYGLTEIGRYSFEPLGGGFMLRYIVGTHTAPLASILMAVGGIGMIMRKKTGYFAGLGSSVYGILLLLTMFILLGGSGMQLSGMLNLRNLYVALMILQTLTFLATIVMLLLPLGKKHFNTGLLAMLGGIGLGVFLWLDYLFCTYVLTPWAFG